MFTSESYELIDCGAHRKLERFGDVVLDRPSPAIGKARISDTSVWKLADFRFEIEKHHQGRWIHIGKKFIDEKWKWKYANLSFELKLTPFGHIGVFPEQIQNWHWIASHCEQLKGLKILNLFAYTGGTTFALAQSGADVVHVDSAANVVNWARRNAQSSNLGDAPIRWIVEDAARFVSREIKRGNIYDGFVADPPTFGRGPKRERWALENDMVPMLKGLMELTANRPKFALVSNHSKDFDARKMCATLGEFADSHLQFEGRPMDIKSTTGKLLNAGHVAKYCAA